jgi:hypothetical protein
MGAIRTEQYKGYEIRIMQDEDPINPRTEWDNPSTMVCCHRRYALGDVQVKSQEELSEHIKAQDIAVWLPLYLYDHSGITISTGSFGDPWDSGQVGIIYMTREQVKANWGWRVLTKGRCAALLKDLKSQVEVYDNYLTGEVYGFDIVGIDGESIDSCWGFYGYEDGIKQIMEECKATIDRQAEQDSLRAHEYQLQGGGLC